MHLSKVLPSLSLLSSAFLFPHTPPSPIYFPPSSLYFICLHINYQFLFSSPFFSHPYLSLVFSYPWILLWDEVDDYTVTISILFHSHLETLLLAPTPVLGPNGRVPRRLPCQTNTAVIFEVICYTFISIEMAFWKHSFHFWCMRDSIGLQSRLQKFYRIFGHSIRGLPKIPQKFSTFFLKSKDTELV